MELLEKAPEAKDWGIGGTLGEMIEKNYSIVFKDSSGVMILKNSEGNLFRFVPPVYEDAGIYPISDQAAEKLEEKPSAAREVLSPSISPIEQLERAPEAKNLSIGGLPIGGTLGGELEKHYSFVRRSSRSGCMILEDSNGILFEFVPPVYEDAGIHSIKRKQK